MRLSLLPLGGALLGNATTTRSPVEIATDNMEQDLNEASLFPNAGEGRCLRWLQFIYFLVCLLRV
jgi:hypothetical protein